MDTGYLGKPCPKCAYVRTTSDTVPDWQCPKCGIAYAKFLQAPSTPAPPTSARPAAASPSTAAPAGQAFGLAMFAHLAILLGFLIPLLNIIVPVVIWQMKGGEDEFAVGCAKEAINFQISILLWWLVLVAIAFLSLAIFPPLVFGVGLLGVVVFFANLILPVIAAVKASSGESYYYPRTWHIFE